MQSGNEDILFVYSYVTYRSAKSYAKKSVSNRVNKGTFRREFQICGHRMTSNFIQQHLLTKKAISYWRVLFAPFSLIADCSHIPTNDHNCMHLN